MELSQFDYPITARKKAFLLTIEFIRYAGLILLGYYLTGCASVPRTKWTDKSRRVCVMPDGISAGDYVGIEHALKDSGNWVVIDRDKSFAAVKREQEMIHQDASDRFMDKEKFAHMRELYSCGAAVVAHSQCVIKQHWLFSSHYNHCRQFASVVDTNTGEVLATSERDANTDLQEVNIVPSWEDTIADLNSAYPKYFEKIKDEQPLIDYKDLSKEHATRMKEEQAAAPESPVVSVARKGKE